MAVSDRENMAVPGSLLQSRPMRRQQGTAGETLNNTYFFAVFLESLLFLRLQSVEAAAHGEREKASEKEKASKIRTI